jgi:Na+/H+ antiporter NhaA
MQFSSTEWWATGFCNLGGVSLQIFGVLLFWQFVIMNGIAVSLCTYIVSYICPLSSQNHYESLITEVEMELEKGEEKEEERK